MISGIQAIRSRNGDLACDFLTRALELAPRNEQVRYWLGNAHRMCQRPKQAEALFRELLIETPANVDAGFALAFLLREEGCPEQAASELLRLSGHYGENLEVLLRIAGFLRDSNQFEAAIDVMQSALASHPNKADLHFKLSRLFQAVGRFSDALEQLRMALDLDQDVSGAWLGLAQLQRFSDANAPDFKRIQQATDLPLGEESSMCQAFAFAKGLDDLGRWPEAWGEYKRGNRLRRASQPWNESQWQKTVEQVLQDTPVPDPYPPAPERHPVFIIGMLRSGTTLLENLLDRHPQVHGRGELNFVAHLAANFQPNDPMQAARREGLASELWKQMRLDGSEQHYYIDKNPLNFRFLGFLLRVMPEARFIHLTRDGRDSCLSCFFQLFQHVDAGFSNDLGTLEHYYRGYLQIMNHWQHLAAERIHTVSYERLVRKPGKELESIQAFLGLEIKDLAQTDEENSRVIRTASHWQARQALHQRSIGRWQNYHAMAPEFFDALAAMDTELTSI